MAVDQSLTEVTVFASATVANVACGFDVMGFALNRPGDEITARRINGRNIQITKITNDGGVLPKSIDKNTAGVAVQALLKSVGIEAGIELEIHKKMPLGSGLGSSAASAVAAVVAVNRLLGSPLCQKALLPFVAQAEKAACGAPHLDNVAPSLLGGFIFISSQQPPEVIELECPVPLFATVIHPRIEIRTEDTRKILQRNIPLSKAITQWGNVGGLVAGLLKGDYEIIGRSLHDEIIEPVRSVLIPAFDEVKEAAKMAGALGSGISGSGPSIFSLSSSEETARRVGDAMKTVFQEIGLENQVYISEINKDGPRIVNEK